MLDIAQKYSSELELLFANTVYDLKYQFYHSSYSEKYIPSTDNWNTHEFVSLDSNDNVIGYIRYGIKRNSYSVGSLCIINFSDNKIVFGKDVAKAIDDIFNKYNFRKMSYEVFVGNPIEITYDKLTKRYGGTIVGIKKQHVRLTDGKLYDLKLYELFRENYIKNKIISRR